MEILHTGETLLGNKILRVIFRVVLWVVLRVVLLVVHWVVHCAGLDW